MQAWRTGTLSIRDSNAGVFLRILSNFYEQLLWRASANGCFWKGGTQNEKKILYFSLVFNLISCLMFSLPIFIISFHVLQEKRNWYNLGNFYLLTQNTSTLSNPTKSFKRSSCCFLAVASFTNEMLLSFLFFLSKKLAIFIL